MIVDKYILQDFYLEMTEVTKEEYFINSLSLKCEFCALSLFQSKVNIICITSLVFRHVRVFLRAACMRLFGCVFDVCQYR